jgi:hypothetical protein
MKEAKINFLSVAMKGLSRLAIHGDLVTTLGADALSYSSVHAYPRPS